MIQLKEQMVKYKFNTDSKRRNSNLHFGSKGKKPTIYSNTY